MPLRHVDHGASSFRRRAGLPERLQQVSSAFRPRFSVFQLGAKVGFYLLSGVLGGTVVGGVGATNCDSPPLVETGMSRQSNEYTNSPFVVFPIGKHFTGSPTLSTGGAGARFGVCANAGDVISTSANEAVNVSRTIEGWQKRATSEQRRT